MTSAFRALLNRLAMLGFERQIALSEALGEDPDWQLSVKDGKATFNGKACGIQLLGTKDDEGTWRWSWDDADSLPAKVIAGVKKVKAVGKKRLCPELAEAEFPLEPVGVDAHMLALVATGLAELPAYFRFPYDGGALFAALEMPDFQLKPAAPERIAMVVREVTSRIDLDDRTATEGYLRARGLTVDAERQRVAAKFPNGRTLEFRFDADGRLQGESGESAGAPA